MTSYGIKLSHKPAKNNIPSNFKIVSYDSDLQEPGLPKFDMKLCNLSENPRSQKYAQILYKNVELS